MSYQEYTVRVYHSRTEWSNSEGLFHRTDGPAIEYADGDKKWYVDGKFHRTDGPAIEYANGGKSWYVEGKRHRTDGPAVEWSDGTKKWYLEGKEYTEEEFKKKMSDNCSGKVVEIDGKKYKLTEV
jgi:hypothetical protein